MKAVVYRGPRSVGVEKENDYAMLSDIWPTGYHATELAGVTPGDSVVVFGAGPVGLMAAYSATLRGASKVMLVDRHADRLALAGKFGAIPLDYGQDAIVERILDQTGGEGADRGCECVGWQAHDPEGREHPEMTMNNLIGSVRATGSIGVVGVFVQKGLRMGTGQADVKAYNRKLRDLIAADKAHPSFLVSHELPLDRAPEAYRRFDDRDEGWTKVILKPAA